MKIGNCYYDYVAVNCPEHYASVFSWSMFYINKVPFIKDDMSRPGPLVTTFSSTVDTTTLTCVSFTIRFDK